ASSLEEERQCSSQAQLSLETRVQELQVHLDAQRAKAQEMSTALGRERRLRTAAGGGGGGGGGGGSGSGSSPEEEEEQKEEKGEEEEEEEEEGERSLLHRLQRDLDEKHAQEGALREARGRLAQLEERAQAEEQRRWRLEEEKEVLEERLAQLQGSGAVAPQDPASRRGESTEHTKDWLSGQETSPPLQQRGPTAPPSLVHTDGGTRVMAVGGIPHLHLEGACRSGEPDPGQGSTSQPPRSAPWPARPPTVVEAEELSWIQSNLDESLAPVQEVSLAAVRPTSVGERLLRQNAELTGFVSRLTEEKSDLATRPCGWRRSYGDTATPAPPPRHNWKQASHRRGGADGPACLAGACCPGRGPGPGSGPAWRGRQLSTVPGGPELKAEVRGSPPEALRTLSSGPGWRTTHPP
ncbi:hypothetical protein CRUP_030169, partial [Coryphaenoides rupestris]